jgi:hypothetical protein
MTAITTTTADDAMRLLAAHGLRSLLVAQQREQIEVIDALAR